MKSTLLLDLLGKTIDVRSDKPVYLNGNIYSEYHSNLPVELTLSQLLSQIQAGRDHITQVQAALDNMQAMADRVLQYPALAQSNTEEDRPALDLNGISLEPGDQVMLVDDANGGDMDTSWDLTFAQKYTIDTLHDEDHLLAPMITLVNSQAGPVFPERFVRVAQGKTTPLSTITA